MKQRSKEEIAEELRSAIDSNSLRLLAELNLRMITDYRYENDAAPQELILKNQGAIRGFYIQSELLQINMEDWDAH